MSTAIFHFISASSLRKFFQGNRIDSRIDEIIFYRGKTWLFTEVTHFRPRSRLVLIVDTSRHKFPSDTILKFRLPAGDKAAFEFTLDDIVLSTKRLVANLI